MNFPIQNEEKKGKKVDMNHLINFFIYSSQILDDDCTPTKNSPGFNIGLPNGHRQFPRLVPETSKIDLSAKKLADSAYACSAFRQLL